MIAGGSGPPALDAAGAWVDLLDGLDGARVLLVDHPGGGAGARLADAASVVGVADSDAAGAGRRPSLLSGRRAQVRFDTEDDLTDDGLRWDVIILDGTMASPGG
ncbi:MAG TPA: hypothetical protein VG078_07660, partial [Acidimicrobiales bacterium]|nr:hypothetical protein [Acidimicrobiales bacterium]